jgi:SAM-dependent methyltransferase
MAENTATHTGIGTKYGEEGARLYASVRHGPDGVFLDPVFLPHITDLHGEVVADIGTGAGPWSIHAVENGAGRVIAVDYQMAMLKNAAVAINLKELSQPGIKDKITVVQADAAYLPIPAESCDKAISINVGCNLPDTQEVNGKTVGFGPHFSEAARILKPDGEFVVTAPINFGTVFTDGSVTQEEIINQIQEKLAEIPDNSDQQSVVDVLKTISQVYRATFAKRGRKWELITDESQLTPGENILRKLPGLVVPNRYHREEDYVAAAKQAGFEVKETVKMSFQTEKERAEYNAHVAEDKRLGPEYVGKSPFVIFMFVKTN